MCLRDDNSCGIWGILKDCSFCMAVVHNPALFIYDVTIVAGMVQEEHETRN